MITAQNITKFFIGLILCYTQLAYSQQPATHTQSATTSVHVNTTGARIPIQQDKEKEEEEEEEEEAYKPYKHTMHLIKAAYQGNIAPLAVYAKRGGDLNACSGYRGESFLTIAIRYNHDHLVAWLLDNGVKIESSSLDSAALLCTNEHNRSLTMMKLLLFHGATSDEPRHYVKGLKNKVNLLGCLIADLADTTTDLPGNAAIDYDLKKVDEVVEKAKLLIGYGACTYYCLYVLTYIDDILLKQQQEFQEWEKSRNTPDFEDVTASYRKGYCRGVEEYAEVYDKLRYHCYPPGLLALGSASNHFLRWLARFDKPNPPQFGKPLTLDPGDIRTCFTYFLEDITDYLAKTREAVNAIRKYVTEFPQMRHKLISQVITYRITKNLAAIVEQYM